MSEIINRLKTGTPQLSVGTLTGDMEDQAKEVKILEAAGLNCHHVDVMNGTAWPKETVDASYVAGINTSLVKDVHLLVDKPEQFISEYAEAGSGIITFQAEHTADIATTLEAIGKTSALRSVGIYPTSDFSLVTDHLENIDVVFVLAIGPDTGKDTFFDIVAERVAKLRELKPELVVAIDGAVKKDNVGEIAKMMPDLIVTGSAVFDGNDAAANIAEMQQSIAEAIA